jgi:predicted signal transduction protein with EAL and GGDEF domain
VFDLPTLLAITVFTSGLAGCLLLFSWLQHRRIFALAFWGSAFIIAAVGTTLIIARGTISDFWSIVIGNAILAAAYGIIWSGVRNFEGKRLSVLLTLAGSLIWLAACSIGPIYALPAARAAVMAAIAVTYALLAVLELARGKGEEVSRWPIMLLLLGHAAAIPVRIPLAGSATDPHPFHVHLLTFAIFETLFVCICAAYLFGGLAKDRIAARYQRASSIDPLTGVANRRGFLQTAERVMTRTRFARQPAALLTFDLDRFKRLSRATFVSSRAAGELRERAAFGVMPLLRAPVLRRCAFAGSSLGLERRFIASPSLRTRHRGEVRLARWSMVRHNLSEADLR